MVSKGSTQAPGAQEAVKALLDTHFLVWIVTGSRRLSRFPWLDRYLPWGISPISLFEMQLLSEFGKLELKPAFHDTVRSDPRFELDDPPFAALIERAIPLSWTRDPFDRLLAAHSEARRSPLVSVDEEILENHALIVRELRA
jgi:PIN domain nuclease of toxin-antitoxin system